MANSVKNSLQLARSSFAVLRGHPRLLLFPFASGLCAIVLAAFFFSPVVVWLFQHGWPTSSELDEFGGTLRMITQRGDWLRQIHPGIYPYAALLYLVSLATAAFFNVAYYHEILRALAGGEVSLSSGLRFATGRWRAIIGWSLLAGTVGVVFRMVGDRLGLMGRIVTGSIGTAWSVAAVFAIPVIVRGDCTNPLEVLRHSARTSKRTWGEAVVGYVGIQFAGVAFLGASTVVMASAVAAAAHFRQLSVMAALGGIWLFGIIALGLFTNMATHIYRCALYVYATEGVVPAPFSPGLMDAGWKVKKA